MEEFGYKVKRGTAEDWETYCQKYEEEYGEPYIPEEGKLVAIGFEDESTGEVFFKLKIGNGNTEFKDLPYTDEIADSGMTVDEIVETLGTKQDRLTPGDGIIIETSTGPNMFNINDSFKSVLTTTGATEENQDYITSNYIKVKSGTTYVISNNYRELKEIAVALYDTDKHFLEYKSSTGTIVNNGFQYYRFNTTEDGYLRFTVYGTNTKIMLNKGTTYLPYEDYVEIENTISATGGSGPTGDVDYHEQVTNKPTINNVEIDGDLTSEDLDLQGIISAGNGIKKTGNEISAKLYNSTDNALSNSSNGLLVSKSALGYDNTLRTYLVNTNASNPLQAKLTAGNGIDITNDEISIGISSISSDILGFASGKLWLNTNTLATDTGFLASTPYSITFRQRLADASVQDALASKEYVDTELTKKVDTFSNTAKGSTISLTDSADSPLDAISIMGKSKQTKTNGYQLLTQMVEGNTLSQGNITATVQKNGTVKLQGTNTASYNITLVFYDDTNDTLPQGSYIMSAKGVNSGCFVGVYNGGTLTADGTKTFTKSASGNYSAYIRITPNTTVDNMEVQFQLESGSMAHDYENYTGGQPSPSINYPQEITDITQEDITITDGTDTQTATLTKTLRGIPVSSGGNYTDNNNQQWLCDTIERYKDGSGKYIQRVGRLDFDGTEDWRDTSTGSRVVLVITNAQNSTSNAPLSMNSNFNRLANNYAGVNYTDNAYVIDTNRYTLTPTQNGVRLTASQWKTYLASNSGTLVYALAEPIETPLTSEELAELNLDTYYPTTNISSNADVVVEYVCDTKNYIDKKFEQLQNAIISQGGNI